MSIAKISTFDDWIDRFKAWQDDIGLTEKKVKNFKFDLKFDKIEDNEIMFGDFRGEKKWETVIQIPHQQMRDALQNLIVYQGDTEFASVEQQRNLFNTAPSDYDFQSLARVMCEEMRHGWQMCYLLVNYFGHSGKIEAQKLLERRAFKKNRLLGSFNQNVDNWLDFYTYTQFIDRDGKFQLKMLSYSGFAPLARSMDPMLKEEAFHLGAGNNGLMRIIKAGKIPTTIIQKYFNKWVPTAFDLFGVDNSSSAYLFYAYGLKGRFDEDINTNKPDREYLNEYARDLYYKEVSKLIDGLNKYVSEGQQKLYVPDLKFNRSIGLYKDQTFSVIGEFLTKEQYQKHLNNVLPNYEDVKIINSIFKEADWIEAKSGKVF
jgi:benzoyl-CoA 2,3-dioxygenase component B